MTHDDEFPIKISACLTRFIKISLPADVMNVDLVGYEFKNLWIFLIKDYR